MDNIFKNNEASSGGSIMILENLENKIHCKIRNNFFTKNIADIGPNLRYLGPNEKLI